MEEDIQKSRPEQIRVPLSVMGDNIPAWLSRDSGWGYTENDPVLILSDNESEGVENEYKFANIRSNIEVQYVLKMHYMGLERKGQSLVHRNGKPYDIIKFDVLLLSDEDWNFLKDDYESHNGYQDDADGLQRHRQMRAERIRYYSSECWIDISAFFGKN